AKKYITLLDRTKVKLIEEELERQRGSKYIDGVTVAQDKLYGAKQLLHGILTSMGADATTTTTAETKNIFTNKTIPASTKTTYQSKLSFALQIVDAETGKVISDKAFDLNSTGSGFLKFDAPPVSQNKEDATSNAIKNHKKRIMQLVNDFVNATYTPPITLATIDTRDKKGFPETVSLVGGTEANLTTGNDLIVYEVQTIAVNGVKKFRKMEIGALKVKAIQGDFTSCKVMSGETVIESKWKTSTLEFAVKPKK
ncbi:MAG TPA: hypothetical protein VJY62_07820, partial [Bacteroidia bacterium]|nr:hypothetical protein [Bacteroidia bacterium]